MSYASEDYVKAHSIYGRLKAEGYNPWIDKENLVGGQDWASEIDKAIEESKFFLACLSNNSSTKEGYVQKELKVGIEKFDKHPWGSIFLIPLRIEECKVPFRFKNIHWIDMFNSQGMENLLKAIKEGCNQRELL